MRGLEHPHPEFGERDTLAEIERLQILRVLWHRKHNVSESARILGISRRTLQRKMRTMGFKPGTPSEAPVMTYTIPL